jgi:two-component system LytT family sensor kinase
VTVPAPEELRAGGSTGGRSGGASRPDGTPNGTRPYHFEAIMPAVPTPATPTIAFPGIRAPRSAPPLTAARAWGIACFAYFAIVLAAVLLAASLPFWTAVRLALLQVLPDCALAPLAFVFARRFPLGRLKAPHFGLLHAAGGAAFVLLSAGGFLAAFLVESRVTAGAWPALPRLEGFVYKGLGSFLVYATVVAAANAVEQARRAARAEVLSAEAQLAALRARLNPHFILNLLHTLMGLVGRDPASAQAALEQLGDVLRYALRVQSQGLDEVRLREEWEFVERYLALERLRLGERLRTRLEVEEDLLDEVVPVFSLQPLVENAVRHAIAPRASGGSIAVRAARDGDTIRLTVDDDGAPARDAGAAAAAGGSGIGLRLIRERLSALYGAAARLETGPSDLGGFRAAVTVPIGETP